MKKLFFLPIMYILMILIIIPGNAQNLNFSGPNEDDTFFVIGWSEDAGSLAYGWYNLTSAISTVGQIVVELKYLDFDQVEYEYNKSWDEGNAGDGMDNWYPKNSVEAWNEIKQDVSPNLDEYNIVFDPVYTTVFKKKLGDIKAEIRDLDEEDEKAVYLISKTYGEEIIYVMQSSDMSEVSVYGFVLAPGEEKAGLIIGIPLWDFPYFEYYVIGFCINEGFGCPEP